VEARVVRVDYGPEDHPQAARGKHARGSVRQDSDSLEPGQSSLSSADTAVRGRAAER